MTGRRDNLAPLLQALSEAAERYSDTRPTRLATVMTANAATTTSGVTVAVRFDGETATAGKAYLCLATYTPTAGDRVILLRVGASYVAIGSVSRPTPPAEPVTPAP